MGYEDLEHFNSVIGKKEYEHISEPQRILSISSFIAKKILVENPITLLQRYKENLLSFYTSFKGENVPDIEKGFNGVNLVIDSVLSMLDSGEFSFLSKEDAKKKAAEFITSLELILSGLRMAFEPRFKGTTKIDKKQMARFLLDKIEGLGKVYSFNSLGKNSPSKKFKKLTVPELWEVNRLLRSNVERDTKSNGWTAIGTESTPIRMLSSGKIFGKDKIFYVYNMREKLLGKKGHYLPTITNRKAKKEPFEEYVSDD